MRIKKTQLQKVGEYLNAGHKLTSLEALNLFGVARLAAVVHKLRDRGTPVKTEMIEVRTRFGSATVARYFVEGARGPQREIFPTGDK